MTRRPRPPRRHRRLTTKNVLAVVTGLVVAALVVALGLAVLFNTAHVVQTLPTTANGGDHADGTGLAVQHTTGTITRFHGQPVVTRTTIALTPTAGRHAIDLTRTTVQWRSPTGTAILVYNDTTGPSAANAYFDVTTPSGHRDHVHLVIELAHGTGALAPLEPGDSVTVTLITRDADTETIRLTVPQNLNGTDTAVAL